MLLKPASAGAEAATSVADAGGQFAFLHVAPGFYKLHAERTGFQPLVFGESIWNPDGSPLVVNDTGQFSAELRLRRLGALTGAVTDENGVGVAGAPVQAYQAAQRLLLAGSGQTDDRGVFRIAGLKPGRYYVRTSTFQAEDGRGLLPTYHGQATQVAGARAVTLGVDEEATGVDIEPLPGRLSKLKVTLVGTAAANVTLLTDAGKLEARVEPSGTTTFGGLALGVYELVAQTEGNTAAALAWQRITVAREEETAVLTLQPAPTIRFRCDTSGAAFDPRLASIYLRRAHVADVEGSRRFTCGEPQPLAPGTWEVGIVAPTGFHVASLFGPELDGDSYRVRMTQQGNQEATILFAAGQARVSGHVTTPDGAPAIGAPVFLRSADPELNSRLGGIRTVRTDEQGAFEIGGLPPGLYEVFSSFRERDPGAVVWQSGRGSSVRAETGNAAMIALVLSD